MSRLVMPSLVIKPEAHWWEASALTTMWCGVGGRVKQKFGFIKRVDKG